MACELLGQTFDIHGGGADLQFPHHENEIAQSEGATGQQFAQYWMHNGFINIDNEKMSKSLGNFFTIRLDQARQSFETMPWVRRASVRREWPNGIVVAIEEHQALGVWVGETPKLINTYGEVFIANMAEAEDSASLLRFSGPEGSFSLLVRPPDVIVLDGEEDKAMWILLKEWLGGKMALYFSFFVTRYFFGRRRTFCGFLYGRRGGSDPAEVFPVVAVVANEVRNLAEGLE